MNCEKYEKLIFLYKENELEPSQQANLEKHLNQCPDCLTKARKTGRQLTSFTASAKTIINEQCKNSNQRIMENLPEKSRLLFIDNMMEQIERLVSPAIVNAIVCIIFLFFAVHEIYLVRKITRLENQVNKLSIAAYNFDQKMQNHKIEELFQYSFSNHTEMSVDDLITLLHKNTDFNVSKNTLYKIISHIPELKSVDIENGIDQEEMLLLIKYSKEIFHRYKHFKIKGDIHV